MVLSLPRGRFKTDSTSKFSINLSHHHGYMASKLYILDLSNLRQDGGSKVLRNVGILPQHNMAPQPWKLWLEYSPSCKPHTSH